MTIGALPLGLGIAGPEDERPVLRLGVQPVNMPKAHANDFEGRAAEVQKQVAVACNRANELWRDWIEKAYRDSWEYYLGGPLVVAAPNSQAPQKVYWSAVSDPTTWGSAEA